MAAERAEPPLAAVLAAITRADEAARTAAREHRAAHPRSLGRLDDLGVWLAGVQGEAPARPLERVRMLLVAGDHGVAESQVSHRPAGSTARLLRETVAGRSAPAVVARSVGTDVRPLALSVDDELADLPAAVTMHAVRRGTGRVDREDAMTAEETAAAMQVGIDVVDEEVDSGAD
ncbi:MAG TPA: nicotinate-nucleotide--dimethylbenzimidazole phosphoribosyltransferase, partial [Actinomycetes bacterium]